MKRPELTIKVGDHEIRWTYGLQLDLQRVMPDSDATISGTMSDTFIRDYIVRRSLTDVKKAVNSEDELISIDEVDLDPDQILELIDWVTGHMLYFFMKSATNLAAIGAEFEKSLPSSPSTSGSEDSASKKESAGRSGSAKAS